MMDLDEASDAIRALAKEKARDEISESEYRTAYDEVKSELSDYLAEGNLPSGTPQEIKDEVFKKAWARNEYTNLHEIKGAYIELAELVQNVLATVK